MKIKQAMRRVAAEVAKELVPLIERAGQRGTTEDAVRLLGTIDAFRDYNPEPLEDYVREWRLVRACAYEHPMDAEHRRTMMLLLGFTGNGRDDDVRLGRRD